jgi:hypothetical protein
MQRHRPNETITREKKTIIGSISIKRNAYYPYFFMTGEMIMVLYNSWTAWRGNIAASHVHGM